MLAVCVIAVARRCTRARVLQGKELLLMQLLYSLLLACLLRSSVHDAVGSSVRLCSRQLCVWASEEEEEEEEERRRRRRRRSKGKAGCVLCVCVCACVLCAGFCWSRIKSSL